MTQEDMNMHMEDGLQTSLHNGSCNNTDDEDISPLDRTSVKEMIFRFERSGGGISSSRSNSNESLTRQKESFVGSFTSIINPLQSHFHSLYPQPTNHNRNSNISVNSILSNASEVSNDSSSSGFASDRRSCADYPVIIRRPAPPPPTPSNDSNNRTLSSPDESFSRERRYSYVTPSTSPIVTRRARQPPVIRRKSIANNHDKGICEALWSYGVRQSDLEKLLRLKRSDESDNDEDTVKNSKEISSNSDSDTDDEEILIQDETKIDAISTDRSTDTLKNENNGCSDADEVVSTTSDVSGSQSNYDNVSIKSISSFDMVPYQKYDSITVSSDEFGSEVCHAPNVEFLTVSAVNEWCKTNSHQNSNRVESKKEKYRRRMIERVNELIHTEGIYVNRLRHVVEDYIPEIVEDDVPPSLRVLKPDIFANIEKIYQFHAEEFLPALKDCENDLKKLGQCFRKFESKFNMYVMYSRSNKRATRLVFEHKSFFQEKQMQMGDRLDLSSYLLEPVQRIPRYKLFLDDLVKTYINYENEKCETDSRISKLSVDSDETGGSNGDHSESDETPLESLKQSKAMVECVLTAIDGIMALENIRDIPPHINLLHQGRLLRQNEFYAMDTSKRRRQLMRVFLFDKLVLLTAVYRKQLTVELFLYKDHIPVEELGMTAKEHDQYKFSIWYKKRNIKSYKLETREPNVRNAWVEDISSLLWDQALQTKEQLLQERSKRMSTVSLASQMSNDDAEKYNSLRGVPGEVRRYNEGTPRRTTWYCE